MSVLSWGKPTVEIGLLAPNGDAPTEWIKLPEIVQDSSQLTTEEGTKLEAIAEGGDVIDVLQQKNRYSFVCQLFVKKGDTKPVEDNDGVILGNYAIRLTPEDATTEGFIMDKTSVNCIETWSSSEGKRWQYKFFGLLPKTGNTLKPYFAPVG